MPARPQAPNRPHVGAGPQGLAVELGAPVQAVSYYGAGYGYLPDGTPVAAVVSTGTPGTFAVADVRDGRVVFSAPLGGQDEGAWAIVFGADGTAYIGGRRGNLYTWRPGEGTVPFVDHVNDYMFSLCLGSGGMLYLGGYKTGHLHSYDTASGQLRDMGQLGGSGIQYVRSLAWHDGTVYAGLGTPAELVAVDVRSGRQLPIPLPPELAHGSMVRGLAVCGDRLLGCVMDTGTGFALDLSDGRITRTFPAPTAAAAIMAPPRADLAVFVDPEHRIATYNTRTDAITTDGPSLPGAPHDFGWFDLEQGPSLVTTTGDGRLWVYTPGTAQLRHYLLPLPPNPLPIQSMGQHPDGDIFLAGYPGGTGARYSPATGAVSRFPLGQVEGFGSLHKSLYAGVYSGADMFRIGWDDQGQPTATWLFRIGEDQDRPFALTAAEDRLFIGTVPTYGQLGGALSSYDPADGSVHTFANVVPDQSVINLTYHDGAVWGTTSVWGGLGATPRAKAAVVFVWDPTGRRIVRSATPSSPSLDAPPLAITGLTFAPDGTLWGGWQGTVFAMDPVTLRVRRDRTYFESNWNIDHCWQPTPLVFGPDGLLYAVLTRQGILVVIDPKTLSMRVLDRGASRVVLDCDRGHLYYSKGERLLRLAL